MISQPLPSQQCFALPELVGEILDKVAPGAQRLEFLPDDVTNTLAILSRTAKLFHEQALDLLWQSIYGMKPLFWCLPDDAWKSGNTDSIDYERFLKYARRIKRLYVSCPNEYISRDCKEKRMLTEEDAGRILANLPVDQGSLSPAATDIKLPVNFFGNRAYRAHLLLGSKVQRLGIYPGPDFCPELIDSMLWNNIANLIRPIAKSLVKFGLSLPVTYAPVEGVLSLYRQSSDLQYLESMSIAINKETFTVLARLARLRHVAFPFEDGKSEDILSTYQSLINTPVFPDLQLVHFRIDHLSPLVDHMKTWSSKGLKEIHVDRSKWNDTWNFDALFETIYQTQNHHTLECISVQEILEEVISPGLQSVQFTISGFRKLFVFENLSAFCISSHIPGIMNDNLLEEVAAAWPQLHTFEFNDNTTRWTSDVSVDGVIKFIAACKNLRTLSLSVDFSSLDHSNFNLERLPSFQKITSLGVRTSVPPSTAEPMVAFLHHVFPRINIKRFGWDVMETVLFRDQNLRNDTEYMRMGGIWSDVDMKLKQEYSLAMIEKMDYEQMTQYQTLLEAFRSVLREEDGEDEEGEDEEDEGDEDERAIESDEDEGDDNDSGLHEGTNNETGEE